MSAKRKSDDPVKPQVIDLGPEDIVVQDSAAASETAQDAPETETIAETAADSTEPPRDTEQPAAQSAYQKPPSPRKSASYALPLAALIAGLLGGGWIYRDLLSVYFPSDQVTSLSERLAASEALAKSGSEKSAALEQQVNTVRSDLEALGGTITTTQSETTALRQSGEATAAKVGETETALATLQKSLDEIRVNMNAVATVPSGTTAPQLDPTALNEIRNRLAAVEAELAALKTAKTELSPEAALTQALSGLRRKINEGAPFSTELAALNDLEPGIAGVADLEAQAVVGLPPASVLALELTEVATKLPAASAASDEEPGYGSWIADSLSGLITVKTVGVTNWTALAKQAAEIAAAGKLAEAVKLIDESEGDKPPQLIAWRDRANGRVALEATLAKLSDAVMQRIAEKG